MRKHSRSTGKKAVLAAVVAAVAVGIAACGNKEPQETTAAQETEATTAAGETAAEGAETALPKPESYGNVTLGTGNHTHVEVGHILGKLDRAQALPYQLGRRAAVLVRERLQHLQRARLVATQRTKDCRGLDATHATRVGHGHALHVLDDVSAARHAQVLRHAA